MSIAYSLATDPIGPHALAPSTSGRMTLSFASQNSTPAVPHSGEGAVANGRRERRLLLVLVAVAHAAGAIGLTRLNHTAEPVIDTPITVALIQAAAVPEAPAAPTAPPAPPAPIAPPEPIAVPEPVPPPPTETAVVPPPEPPPQIVPEPPKPRPQPVPKKPAVVPQPVTEAPTAIAHEEPPPAPPAPQPAPPAPAATPSQPAPAPAAMPSRPAPAPRAQARQNSQPRPVTGARFDAAYLNNPAPAYPALSRRMREQGRVLLRVFVTTEGRAGRIELSESSGSSRLDSAAEAAVSRWRFIPARQGDRDTDAWVIVPIVFKLEGH